jgi:microcystin-dependent protein
MSEPFLAEIRIVGFNFAPRGWAFCDGQILPINQNQSLYSLLGTTYGGDGRTSFGLPDLRGRTPIHEGNGHSLGHKGGYETHLLDASEIPPHRHTVRVSNTTAAASTVGGNYFASNTASLNLFNTGGTPNASMDPSMLANAGGQAHNNMQPYTTLAFCIAMRGLFPSRD